MTGWRWYPPQIERQKLLLIEAGYFEQLFSSLPDSSLCGGRRKVPKQNVEVSAQKLFGDSPRGIGEHFYYALIFNHIFLCYTTVLHFFSRPLLFKCPGVLNT